MSKTLSEDSEGKRASANEFGTRQLFRRPAPTAAASTVDWAVANGESDTIVANNTVHDIHYDSVDIAPDSTHFQFGATGALKPIDIILSGWYMIQLEAWPQTAIGDFILGLTFSGSGYPYNFSYSAGGLYARLSTSITAASNSLEVPTVATFGPVYLQARPHLSGTVRMGGIVYHAKVTPGSLAWNYGTLAIVALGDGLGLPQTEDWNPDGLDHDEQFRHTF